MSDALLQLHGVSRNFGKKIAVDDITLDLLPGEVLGVVGPNGAGKTTLLRMISGVIPPARGQVHLCGHDLDTAPVPAKQQLGFVPDTPMLYEVLTPWEHLRFLAQVYRVNPHQAAAEALLREFGLVDERDKPVSELSKGTRQRVMFCCALLHAPKVIVFDEPISGLDPMGLRALRNGIQARAEAGACVVISSHILGLIEDVCTSLLVLHEGRSRYCGAMEGARESCVGLESDTSFEEVFLHLTETSVTEQPE